MFSSKEIASITIISENDTQMVMVILILKQCRDLFFNIYIHTLQQCKPQETGESATDKQTDRSIDT